MVEFHLVGLLPTVLPRIVPMIFIDKSRTSSNSLKARQNMSTSKGCTLFSLNVIPLDFDHRSTGLTCPCPSPAPSEDKEPSASLTRPCQQMCWQKAWNLGCLTLQLGRVGHTGQSHQIPFFLDHVS